MYTVVFPHNKRACSFSPKRGNFSTENLDKTETLLSDHHFPQATCWFLSGVTVFNQSFSAREGGGTHDPAMSPPWRCPVPRGTPRPQNPPHHKNSTCCCSQFRATHWEGPRQWVKAAVGSEVLLVAPGGSGAVLVEQPSGWGYFGL